MQNGSLAAICRAYRMPLIRMGVEGPDEACHYQFPGQLIVAPIFGAQDVRNLYIYQGERSKMKFDRVAR